MEEEEEEEEEEEQTFASTPACFDWISKIMDLCSLHARPSTTSPTKPKCYFERETPS